jgi:hypothetical protein
MISIMQLSASHSSDIRVFREVISLAMSRFESHISSNFNVCQRSLMGGMASGAMRNEVVINDRRKMRDGVAL